jgi:flagellar motor switch protein FliM
MGEKFGRDPIWESHLAREMWSTSVGLDAVLEEQTVSLSDVARLEVGSTLRLRARADSQIVLRCGNVPMARGRIGRRGDRIIIEVDERIDRDKESNLA